jgi:2Fe-2S ferredoxin
MVKISFASRGIIKEIEAAEGSTLMQVAVDNNIPGIEGECGGACSCATCHVHVAEPWFEIVGQPGGHERTLLEFTEHVAESSRLSCQIVVARELDGIRLFVPQEIV